MNQLSLYVARAALAALALTALCGLPAAAQEGAPAAVFGEVTEVNVVNVEVVVTDRRGQPVRGLTRDDFELRENGKPIEISNFYSVEGGTEVSETAYSAPQTAAEPPVEEPALDPRERQSHLVVYVDNANISENSRKQVFRRLREFLQENWRPNLWVMVVSNDRSFHVRQDFTSDAGAVFRSLDQLATQVSAGPRFDSQRRTIMRMIEDVNVEAGSGLFGVDASNFSASTIEAEANALVPMIRAYSQERYQHTRDTLRILNHFVAMAAGMPGRKSVLYVSDGLSLRPGEALFEGFSRRFQVLGDVSANFSPESEAARDDASADFEELVTSANSSGVTFYTLDAAPSSVLARGSAETGVSAGGNFGSWKDAIESTEQSNRQASLVMMADGTGGRHGLTLSAFDGLFEGVLSDFDNYYSLGYVADRLAEGKRRNVKVSLRGEQKGLRLRYRQSFRDKTIVERANERAQAALLVEGLANPLGITLEPRDREPQADGNEVVHLLVKLPIARLLLLPGTETHQGRVSMFVAVRDDKGRTSKTIHQQCPISIPTAEIESARSGTAACGVRLLMRQGRQKVAVSVLDEVASIHSTASLDIDV